MFTAHSMIEVVLKEMDNDEDVRRRQREVYGFDFETGTSYPARESKMLKFSRSTVSRLKNLFNPPPCAAEATCG